jgi:hypothetical protein
VGERNNARHVQCIKPIETRSLLHGLKLRQCETPTRSKSNINQIFVIKISTRFQYKLDFQERKLSTQFHSRVAFVECSNRLNCFKTKAPPERAMKAKNGSTNFLNLWVALLVAIHSLRRFSWKNSLLNLIERDENHSHAQLHKLILIARVLRLTKSKSRTNVDKQLRIIKKRENMVFKYSLSIMKSITFH